MTSLPEYAGLRLALTTFTVFPVRGGQLDRRTAGRAMAWGPAIGAALAGVAAIVIVALRFVSPGPGVPRLISGAAAVGVLALLTRGLHLDGLADTVDALGVPSRERALAVMKQSDIGAFGVVALILVLLLQVASLTSADIAQHGTRALVLAVATGRIAIAWACLPGVSAARPDGLGALVAGTVRRAVPICWSVAAVAVGSGWAYLDDRGRVRQAVIQGVAVVLALGITRLVQARFVRRFGGITGDVLGALCEIATTVALVFAAASPTIGWFGR